jgi:hypothetical protein
MADSARRDEDRVRNQVIPGIPSLAALNKISQDQHTNPVVNELRSD